MDKKSRLKEELRLTEMGRDFLENVELPKHTNSLPIKADDRIKPYKKVDAIPIPDGATNRDMFKAVFGYEPATDAVVCNEKDWCGDSEPCNYCRSNPDSIGKDEDWWNAPYKKEVEE